MKIRRFAKNNFALAGVLEAILLIALVAIVLSMIQLTYVPAIMEQKEADHMDQVANQFSQLKSTIEIQSMMGVMDTGEPITYTPMSSMITMGSRELPYFISARSYGQVDLTDKDDAGDYKINIQPAPANFPTGIPLTSIKYRANNFYYPTGSESLPLETWQEYILEGGGIILKQSNGEVMRVYPSFEVENHSDLGYIKIKYFIPVFDGILGKKNYGGWQDCFVYTNYSTHYSHTGNAVFIHIYTEYPDAWYNATMDESVGLLREFHDNGYLTVVKEESTSPRRIEITPGSMALNLELTITEIGVQVGPGYAIPSN